MIALEKPKRINNYFDGMPMGKKHKLLFALVMCAYFFEQFDINNFGFATPAMMKSFGVGMDVIARINSLAFLGMMLGGFFGGLISDKIGRRKTFLASLLVFSVASVCNGLTYNIHVFMISRLITGFGVFCMMIVSIAYISEMSPAESRGKWQGLIGAVGLIALPLVGVLANLFNSFGPQGWRILFYVGGSGIIAFLIGIKALDESPRWLVSRGRIEEAEKIVEKLSGEKIDLSEVSRSVPPKESVRGILKSLANQGNIGKSFLFLLVFACFTTIVMSQGAWNTILISKKGFDVQQSIMIATIMTIGAPLGAFVASLISDKGGRKIPLSVGFIVNGLGLWTFATLGNNFWVTTSVGLLAGIASSAVTFMLYSYVAENYPTKARNTATGLHNGFGRLTAALVQPVIPLIYASTGQMGVYTLFAILAGTAGLLLLIFGKPTSGKSLEDIS